ncbi:MAG: permease [Candidatus Omnitrophica bacterium]|nr:permease [Candidatus Omnitrophota bacterium]
MIITNLFIAGIKAVIEYASSHVLTCLVPAFFIAGAMSALLPKEKITQYLGQKVPKYKAYPLSIAAGLLLAVCSCTILPLFAGIKKKGAGIGPALAFLYTAPATNIMAILFTGSVLGWNFALARIILSVTFASLIGVIISTIFKKEDMEEEKNATAAFVSAEVKDTKNLPFFQKHRLILFFITLVAILIAGTRLNGYLRYISISGLIIILTILTKLFFTKEETKAWLSETWIFTKKIFPLLLGGIFVAGVLTELLPQNFLATFMGKNTLSANFIAVLFGVFMYFPTLVEVPMAKMFLGLGMAKGPLLAYLLADPVISLASILVVRKFIGDKRTLVYVGLIILFTTISGLIYGAIVN